MPSCAVVCRAVPLPVRSRLRAVRYDTVCSVQSAAPYELELRFGAATGDLVLRRERVEPKRGWEAKKRGEGRP